jgi:hypothetical protein
MKNTKALLDVLKQNPTLTIDGFGIEENTKGYAGYNPALSKADLDGVFDQKRRALIAENNLNAFEASRAFLQGMQCTKHTSKNNPSSYQLKHMVERWADRNAVPLYVPVGAFIAAALSMAEEKGIKTRPINDGMGALFNIKRPAFA